MRHPTRTRFDASLDKRAAVENAEAAGIVADSGQVRLALMMRVQSGEITLADAQHQLKKIKAGAKKNGLLTRARAYNQG